MKRLLRPTLERADVAVRGISLAAAFIEHIDHTAVLFLAIQSSLICLSAEMLLSPTCKADFVFMIQLILVFLSIPSFCD